MRFSGQSDELELAAALERIKSTLMHLARTPLRGMCVHVIARRVGVRGIRARARRLLDWQMIAIVAALALANWYLWSSTAKAHRDADQSAYVQQHGIASVGTVTAVDNVVHKYGEEGGRLSGGLVVHTWTHALISVHLSSPVHGVSDTVVQYPDKSELQVGSSVSVVVDPRDPRYAELPGRGARSKHGWVVLLVLSVMVASPLVLLLSQVLVGWPASKRKTTRD